VSACNPSSAALREQLTVQVTGANFRPGAAANFGPGVIIREVTFVSTSRLDVNLKLHPKAPLGSRTVTVTNDDGQSGSLVGCFTVN
jgi:hypothetical protein